MKSGQRLTDQQKADARNKRQAKRWPMLALAGLLEQTTAEEVRAASERSFKYLEEMRADWQARECAYYLQLESVAADDELLPIVRYRLEIGHGPEYGCDIYHRALLVLLFFRAFHPLPA